MQLSMIFNEHNPIAGHKVPAHHHLLEEFHMDPSRIKVGDFGSKDKSHVRKPFNNVGVPYFNIHWKFQIDHGAFIDDPE